MRLNKRELAAKLLVSERALTDWARLGMPVVTHRARGQQSTYDLAAVVAWVRRTRDPRYVGRVPLEQLERECGLAPAPVQTSASTADQAEAIRLGLGLEAALLRLPAIAAQAGVSEAHVEALVLGLVVAIGEEVDAETAEAWRAMLDQERAHPGVWTT